MAIPLSSILHLKGVPFVDKVEIEDILRELEEHITGASRIPLTGKVLVDGDVVLEYVDKIYAVLPEELKQAKQVLEQSDKLLESMEAQGKRILEDANKQAAMLLTETEIYREAQVKAEQILMQADQEANALRQDALSYADDVLQQLEMNLEKAGFSIKKSREDLRSFRAY